MIAACAFLLLVLVSYFIAKPEPRCLDAQTRMNLGGSYARLADGVVHYELSGPRDGRVVVLVHGGGLATLDAWTPLMDFEDRRILRYDLYGQGLSDRPHTVYDSDLFDRQLDQLLARLGIRGTIDLVGHSMGGLIAATYAARHPERIESLTLIAPAGIETRMHWTVKLAQIPIVGEYMFRVFGRQLAASCQNEIKCLEFEGSRRAMLSHLRNMPFSDADVFARVGELDFPVLALFGKRDRTVPMSASARLERWIPHVEIYELEQATHGLLEDHATEIGELVTVILSREDGEGSPNTQMLCSERSFGVCAPQDDDRCEHRKAAA
jgi:pimeloyl-ACP methyl ester carboxylesterase